MYSIGNEVTDPIKDEGIKVEKNLIDHFHKCDPTRPTTIGYNIMIALMVSKGVNFFEMANDDEQKKDDEVTNTSEAFNELTQSDDMKMNTAGATPDGDNLSSPCFDILDIAGYNYASERIALDPVQHPNRVSVGSETLPGDIYHNWELCKKYPNCIGDFMWTAWDYIGETGAGAWAYTEDGKGFTKPYPWLLGGAGVIDICGDETGELGYIKTVWDVIKKPYICVQPVNHPGFEPYKSMWRFTNGLPSWTWRNCNQNDAKVEVFAKAHSVKLILNGKEVGVQKVDELKTLFIVKYEPGTLEAISLDENGSEIARSKLVTANENDVKIVLSLEENEVKLNDIVYVKVRISDSDGIIESNDDSKVKLNVVGGELLGFGSANPRSEEKFTSGEYTTYYGRALAVIRCTQKGVLYVIAEDNKGRKASTKITVI